MGALKYQDVIRLRLQAQFKKIPFKGKTEKLKAKKKTWKGGGRHTESGVGKRIAINSGEEGTQGK